MSNSEAVTQFPMSARTIRGKTTVTMAARTYKRQLVETRNAPEVSHSIDGDERRFFKKWEIGALVAQDFIPLSEISYWLLWANQITLSSGEKYFDFPTAEGLLAFLKVIRDKYTVAGLWDKTCITESSSTDAIPQTVLVPAKEYQEFLVKADNLDREELITSLDEFVGQYIAT